MSHDSSASTTLDEAYADPLPSGTGFTHTDAIDLTPFRYLKRRMVNIGLLGAADVAALGVGLSAAGALRFFLKGESMIPEWAWIVLLAWVLGALFFGLLPGWGLGAVEELRRVALLTVAVFAVVSTGLFLGKTGSQTSRLTLTTTFALAIPLLLFFRLEVKRLLIKRGTWGLPTVIYGGGRTARLAVQALHEERGLGYAPVGIFTGANDARERAHGLPVLGSVADSTRIAPAAILAMPDVNEHSLVDLLEGPLSSYRQVLLIPDLADAPSLWVNTRDLGGVLGLEVSHNLMDPLARVIKRVTDLFLVIATAPLWLPVCAVIYAAIHIEGGGGAIFGQMRVGRGGVPFETWKFRTMVTNAEQVLEQRLSEDQALRTEWETNFKLKNDPRITRIGSLLRKTSLDELPQLFNVLFGSNVLGGAAPLCPCTTTKNSQTALRRCANA